MEFLSENLWLAWVIAGIFFLVLELVTTALVSIWFVPAAVITCVISLFLDSFIWQVAIFLVLSAIFMLVFRSIYKKKIKRSVDDVKPEEQMLGRFGVVSRKTDIHGGKVLVGDIYWRAITEGETFVEGETVKIKGTKGTTLIIEKTE